MKRTFLLLLAGAWLASGCGGPASDGKIRVGVMDTTRILEEMPKYKDLRDTMTREKIDFQRKIQDRMASVGENATEEQKKEIGKEVAKKQSEFQNRVNQMLQTAIKDIKDLTAQVAEEKHLDLVVVSTPFSPSVHYNGGQDVTIDVLLKLKRI